MSKQKTKPITIRISEDAENKLLDIVDTIHNEIKHTGAEVTLASVTRVAINSFIESYQKEQEGALNVLIHPKDFEILEENELYNLSRELIKVAAYMEKVTNEMKTENNSNLLEDFAKIFNSIQGTVNDQYVRTLSKNLNQLEKEV